MRAFLFPAFSTRCVPQSALCAHFRKNPVEYEIYAIRYAASDRLRSENFVGGDPHDGPMPLDYFVWLLKSPARNVLVDTGFNAATAKARNRNLLRCPIEALNV